MKSGCADLIRAVTQPESMAMLSLPQWDLLLRQARAAGMLGRLGAMANRQKLTQSLPINVQDTLEADLTFARQQACASCYEFRRLDRALKKLGVPVLLLKGAAYVALDLPVSDGRFMSDIDILIAKPYLGDAESALTAAGWMTLSQDTYDQRYYRVWMHELPPMRHMSRHTLLDVHHNVLPETARIRTRPDEVLARAQKLPGYTCLYTPNLTDLILHSATHLMHEGEWGHGLRDLSDLYLLIAPNTGKADFWPSLLGRARDLNLHVPLYYALLQLHALFGLAIPLAARIAPKEVRFARLMHLLIRTATLGFHASCRSWLTPMAEFFLYVRSHWLRMPPHLLIPHLIYKAWQKRLRHEASSE